eukprot:GEMP01066425.1.p1 GENE.GEMP01066425.1~~GEMP01066425.1.p1  ORF type:complete len:284 (+),score=50.13 GEMP01066425.1:29-880(+)
MHKVDQWCSKDVLAVSAFFASGDEDIPLLPRGNTRKSEKISHEEESMFPLVAIFVQSIVFFIVELTLASLVAHSLSLWAVVMFAGIDLMCYLCNLASECLKRSSRRTASSWDMCGASISFGILIFCHIKLMITSYHTIREGSFDESIPGLKRLLHRAHVPVYKSGDPTAYAGLVSAYLIASILCDLGLTMILLKYFQKNRTRKTVKAVNIGRPESNYNMAATYFRFFAGVFCELVTLALNGYLWLRPVTLTQAEVLDAWCSLVMAISVLLFMLFLIARRRGDH